MDSKPHLSEVNAEFAAKRACELLGLDPEKQFQDEDGYLQPEWCRWIPEIRKQFAINSALMEAGCGMARIERK